MSDREREIFSERYEQSVYDCDPYPALLVQAKLSLEQAKRGESIPPWGVQEICIAESEKAVACEAVGEVVLADVADPLGAILDVVVLTATRIGEESRRS